MSQDSGKNGLPFVLLDTVCVPDRIEPAGVTYDQRRQLWVANDGVTPYVRMVLSAGLDSEFGETSITETREGTDQPDVAEALALPAQVDGRGQESSARSVQGHTESLARLSLQLDSRSVDGRSLSSQYGETTRTGSQEGTDVHEGNLASDFGETTYTRTREGVDASESLRASDFGETTKTATIEGTDQPEVTASTDSHIGHGHEPCC